MYSSLSFLRRYFIGLAICGTVCTFFALANLQLLFYNPNSLHNRFTLTLAVDPKNYLQVKNGSFVLSNSPLTMTGVETGKLQVFTKSLLNDTRWKY